MNTKKMPAAIALLSLLALSGCGSDSDSSSDPQRPIVDTDKVHESLEVAVTPKSELEGTINVYLGHWYPCSDLHPEMCTQDADLNDLPAIGVHGDENDPGRLTYGRGNPNGTYNKEHNRLTARPGAGADDYSMKISAAELSVLPPNPCAAISSFPAITPRWMWCCMSPPFEMISKSPWVNSTRR